MKMGANHPMGPIELADLVGLDTVLSVMKVLEEAFGAKYHPCPFAYQTRGGGLPGVQTGRGFYHMERKNKERPGEHRSQECERETYLSFRLPPCALPLLTSSSDIFPIPWGGGTSFCYYTPCRPGLRSPWKSFPPGSVGPRDHGELSRGKMTRAIIAGSPGETLLPPPGLTESPGFILFFLDLAVTDLDDKGVGHFGFLG